jgi:hypothetical protein
LYKKLIDGSLFVENSGEVVFSKILGGGGDGSRLSGKNCQGSPLILGFIGFLITSVLKFA